TLIKAELEAPALLQLLPHLRDPQNITLQFTRDAWQIASRQEIKEKNLGGGEFRLSEFTENLWRTILIEGIDCLNKDHNYRGRGLQAVTRVRKAGIDANTTDMPVSPHLTIWTPIDPLRASFEDLSSAIEHLKPIHEWASKVSS
ncbi:MAG: hypothetical protein K2Q15_07355, partial [Burkholderiales bacterium]|nr:hypothetical protein [Candidatus Obscuribacterales bacterium]MBY0445006.1 hypothetical protein [Burkholderiales bacterium]